MFFLGKIVLRSEPSPIGTVFSNRSVVSGLRFMFLRYFELFVTYSSFIRFKCSLYRCEAKNMYYLMERRNIIFSRLLTDFSGEPYFDVFG